MKIDIERDFERLRKRLDDTQRKQLPKALNRTVKRVGKATERVIYKAVSKDSGVKQKDLRRKRWFTAHFGNVQSAFYKLRVRYGAVSLKDFRPKQMKPGVKASAWGERKLYRHTFISVKSFTGTFSRGASKISGRRHGENPENMGPNDPQLNDKPETMRQADEVVARRFFPELPQNLRFFTRKR